MSSVFELACQCAACDFTGLGIPETTCLVECRAVTAGFRGDYGEGLWLLTWQIDRFTKKAQIGLEDEKKFMRYFAARDATFSLTRESLRAAVAKGKQFLNLA